MVRTILARIHARPANVAGWVCVRVYAESDGSKDGDRGWGDREGWKERDRIGRQREKQKGRQRGWRE